MSWSALLAMVEPNYTKGEMGRKPAWPGIMVQVDVRQQGFELSDPGVKDAPHESPLLQRFAGIDPGRAPVPDETTILKSRYLLEAHALRAGMLDAVNLYRAARTSVSPPAPSLTRSASTRAPLKFQRQRRHSDTRLILNGSETNAGCRPL